MVRAKRVQSDESTSKGELAGTGTLTRGMAIMDVLLQARQPMTLAEIADAVALEHSTCLRLLRSLEEVRMILRLEQNKKYICSPKALAPLPLLHPVEQLRREAAGLMYDFVAEVNASLTMVLFLAGERMVVQVTTGAGTLNPYYNSWLNGPMHGSGPGKAYLMSLTPEERRNLIGEGPFENFTPHTIRDLATLETDITLAQERGYAVVRDEFYMGLSAISCNFSSRPGKVVGCFALTEHSREFTPDWVASTGEKLVALARLLPMTASSLPLIEALCCG